MVDFDFIRKETPSISFFFSRLVVFLKSSSGHRPQVGLFVPRNCGAFKPVLIGLYPLLRRSLVAHHLEMTTIEYRDSDVKSSKLKTSLSSSGESSDKDFEIVVSKPSSSSKPFSSSKIPSSSIPFLALSKSCLLKMSHLKSIHKKFQFPKGVSIRLPRPNEKACTFAHDKVSFYEATYSCGLHFSIHPFIMQLLFALNVAPSQLVPNAWRMIIGYMSIWVSIHDGDMMGILNFYLGIGSLESSVASLIPFVTGSHDISSFLDLDGKPCLTTCGVRSHGCYEIGKSLSWCVSFFLFIKQIVLSYTAFLISFLSLLLQLLIVLCWRNTTKNELRQPLSLPS